jgi:leader peptidase (prepilin peptidase)/N-methyltransferase
MIVFPDLPAFGALALPAWSVLLVAGVWLSVIDAREHRLPNRIVLPATAIGAGLIAVSSIVEQDLVGLMRAMLGAVITFGALLILALPRATGMGMGDVKLGLLTGMYLGWLGWTWLVLGLCVAFVLAGGWAVALLALGRAHRRTAIAFGPFMITGVLACAVGAVALAVPMGAGGLSG